jgi:hypothetical protein
MKRIRLEKTPRDVQQFVRNLVGRPQVIEFEENGQVLLRLLAAPQLTAEEKVALLRQGRRLVARARERNRNVSARRLDKEARKAVQAVSRKAR